MQCDLKIPDGLGVDTHVEKIDLAPKLDIDLISTHLVVFNLTYFVSNLCQILLSYFVLRVLFIVGPHHQLPQLVQQVRLV